MSYVVIEDFRGGLDRRRKRVVGQPGTLWNCENAVITRGGEVDKRKKFVNKYQLPADTFGMESAAGSIYVFGSASEPAGIPSGVTYQQLAHPSALPMTAIIDTEVFDGQIYAIAQYNDASIHHFYNGARVTDWDGGANNPASKGIFALTYASKVHSLADSIDYYSKVNDPTDWTVGGTGVGFQNMASQDSGSEVLVSIGKFQGNLVFFARRSAQIWFVEEDDANNALLQTLENTGTVAGKSVLSFGDTDLFYLSDSGIRSLRQANGTSNVYSNDVGTAIDEIITEQMAGLSASELSAGLAVIEPRENRYWLTLGTTTYVFNYFPASKISAWSTFAHDNEFTNYTVIGNKVYARSGNVIYLYGGDNGATYDTGPGDAYTVTVSTPFLSAGRIASDKYVTGFDLAVDGTWIVNLLHDPRNDARKTRLGIVTDTTYTEQDLAASGYGPVFALEIICETPGAAKIANLSLHYEDAG